jgi:uncharacterized protein (TIGR02687 family)
MENSIAQALLRLFERHRVVFWYDAKHELRADYYALQLGDIEKLELTNNEFGVKHRILREHPERKFLIYRDGPQPSDLDNWLLDVQLAHTEFRTDQTALWLAELELGFEFAEVVQDHAEFYQSAKRKDALKRLLTAGDTRSMIRLKLLAVCAGADARLDNILEHLLAELAERRDEKLKLIIRYNLQGFLWDQMQRFYGYSSSAPGVEDFAIELFKSCYAMGTEGIVKLNGDALVFLKRWKDSRTFEAAFEALSKEYALVLQVEQDLNRRDFQDLMELDYFRIIDQKIINDLVRAVENRTISAGDCTLLARQRRQSHWYGEFRDLYEAVDAAAQFIYTLDAARLNMESAEEGIQRYSQTWFKLDQLYRRFIYHIRRSGEATLLGTLGDQIENLYTNNYLLKLNNNWQAVVDATQQWPAPGAVSQADFFEKWVRPFLKSQKKVFVIVSDALRYEIGDELLGLIRQEDRYEATIQPTVAMLPSFTQLGMAALLPHRDLELTADNGAAIVRIGGQSSQGTANRSKLLNAGEGWRGKALSAEDLLAMPREGDDGYRALFRENDVVYIYHNRIDAVGDKRDSEERVFEAARETLDELIKIIRKLSSANVTNMIVTTDHGFIYQNRPIAESDFSGCEPSGKEILFRDRRFVLGRELDDSHSFKKFTSSAAGLSGDVEMLIPKSISRLRLKGSGSRFVHGGASLQEVVVPVIQINKKRQSDLRMVDVDILPVGSSTITSGQVAVAFYQTEAVSDKVQPRNLKAGIYTQAGELISDCRTIRFDLTSENPREREMKERFILTREADKANGQDVFLKLTEMIGQTSHPKDYKSIHYTLRRSFTSDFDM